MALKRCVLNVVAVLLALIASCSIAYKPPRALYTARGYAHRELDLNFKECGVSRGCVGNLWATSGRDSGHVQAGGTENSGAEQKHKYRDPTRPTDGRPGVRRSTNSRVAGKSKGKGSRVKNDVFGSAYRRVGGGSMAADGGKSNNLPSEEAPAARERHQQLQYQQRTERLYDSLSSISSASQFLQKLSVRKDRASLDFDQRERSAFAAALDKYLPAMSASQTASLISYLGTFTSSRTNWRSGGEDAGGSQVGQLKKHLMKVSSQLSASDMAATISGLARMNLDWQRTFPNNKNSFTSRLTTLLDGPSGATSESEGELTGKRSSGYSRGIVGAQLGDVIWGLGSMNARLSVLPKRTRDGLVGSFQREWSNLNTFSLSSALWALSKTGLSWNDIDANTRRALPRRLTELGSKMSPQQSSKVLWALGTMGAKLGSGISKETLLVLITNMASHKRSKTGSAIGESQCLIGVAKLGTQWSLLDRPTKLALLEVFSRVCKAGGSSRGVSNSFWAMGTMGLPAGTEEPGGSSSSSPSPSPSPPSSSSEGDSFNSAVPETIRTVMMAGGARAASDATAWAMCNLVWGLSKMKVDWNHLDSDLQTTLMTNIARLENDMNSVDICILLWSLGAMSCPLDTAPPFFTTALLNILDRNLDRIEAEELSKAIWGLSSCSVTWAQLTPSVRWKLNVALRRVGDEMCPQGVANCAYGMAMMAFDWERPSEAAFRGVHETLLSIVIRNKMGIFARRDGMDAYRRVKQEANRRNRRVSSERFDATPPLAGGEGEGGGDTAGDGEDEAAVSAMDMDIDLENMPVYVQDIDTDKILRMTKEDEAKLTDQERQQQQEYEQLRIFAHYLNVMKFTSDIGRIPKELLASTAREKDYGKGSRLQSRVLKGLQRGLSRLQVDGNDIQVEMDTASALVPADERTDNDLFDFSLDTLPIQAIFGTNPVKFGISLEASSFQGVFPVDAAVVQGKRDVVAIIEVNGPTHYRYDGRLKRKDQLKEAMYMKQHPDATFHRIRYNDANKLGSDYIGEEVANAVLGSVKDQSPLGKMFRRTKQQLGDFFSWGLRNDRVVDEPGPDGRG